MAALGLATADSHRPSSYTHSNRISIPPTQICVVVSDPPSLSCGLGDSELEELGGQKRCRSSSKLFVHIDELDLKIKKYLRGKAASFKDLKDRNLKHQLSVREELYGNVTKVAAKAEKEESNPYAISISMGIFRVLGLEGRNGLEDGKEACKSGRNTRN
ncbi:uncharacterized protein DS421_13g416160 [Arachis hypogaea]|nr:uncharacterized protein DS421_13g416160 [Arachis hypogaea]